MKPYVILSVALSLRRELRRTLVEGRSEGSEQHEGADSSQPEADEPSAQVVPISTRSGLPQNDAQRQIPRLPHFRASSWRAGSSRRTGLRMTSQSGLELTLSLPRALGLPKQRAARRKLRANRNSPEISAFAQTVPPRAGGISSSARGFFSKLLQKRFECSGRHAPRQKACIMVRQSVRVN